MIKLYEENKKFDGYNVRMVTLALNELNLNSLRQNLQESKSLILIKGKLVLKNDEFVSYITDIDIKYQHIVVLFINHSYSPVKSIMCDKHSIQKMLKDKVREYFLEVEDMNICDLYDFINNLLLNKKTDIAFLLHLELRFADLKEYLLSYRDQLDFKDYLGNNLLHLACYYNSFELVRWLTSMEDEAQTNYDLTDRSQNMISDTSRDLKTLGNSVYKSNFSGLYDKHRWKPSEEENHYGEVPLQIAAKYSSYDIVYFLINKNKERGFKLLNKHGNYIVTLSMFNYGLRPRDRESAAFTCAHWGPEYNMDPIYGYRYVDKYEVAVGLFNMVTDSNLNLDIFQYLYVEDLNKNIFDYFNNKLAELIEVFPSGGGGASNSNNSNNNMTGASLGTGGEWHHSESLISKLMCGIANGYYLDKDNMMMRLLFVISRHKHLFLDSVRYRDKIKVILDIYNSNPTAFAYDLNFVNWIKQINVDNQSKKYKIENELDKKGMGKGFVPLWKKKFYEDIESKYFAEYHPVSAVSSLWTADLRTPLQQSYFNGSKPYHMPKHYNIVTYSAPNKQTQPKYNKLFPLYVQKNFVNRSKSEQKITTIQDFNKRNEARQSLFISENEELRLKLNKKLRRTQMRTRSNEGVTNINSIATISLENIKKLKTDRSKTNTANRF